MVLTHPPEFAVEGATTESVVERQHATLVEAIEQLAGLRFAIVLSARWESSEDLELSERNDLREELRMLRTRYSDKIDQIAMTYGVQAAINAKEGVEREVKIPKTMLPPLTRNADGK
jgi:hypothetical protein